MTDKIKIQLQITYVMGENRKTINDGSGHDFKHRISDRTFGMPPNRMAG